MNLYFLWFFDQTECFCIIKKLQLRLLWSTLRPCSAWSYCKGFRDRECLKMNAADLCHWYNKYDDTECFFRNVSRIGGACAERKTCQCRITFHSLQPLGIRYQHEPGILLDCRSTSKKLTEHIKRAYKLYQQTELLPWFLQFKTRMYVTEPPSAT